MATLNKWKIYDHPRVNWQPHKGQLKVAENECRHQVVAAGRRWGKSLSGGKRLLPEVFYTRPIANQLLLDGKKRVFWIVGPNYSDSEKEFRVFWNDCKKLEIPMDKGSYNSPETGDMRVSLWGGAMEVKAMSAQIPERLVGEGLCGVILSEAAKLKKSIWPKYIRPTLADFNGWSYSSSTPEGKNWFYDLWRSGQDPANTSWASWRMPAWVNHYVYKTPTKEADVMKLLELQRKFPGTSIFKLAREHQLTIDAEILDSINELTPEAFLQEIGASFTEFVGRVFKDFDEETHVTDLEFNPRWDTVAAVDYGYHNPNVWLLIQIGPWGEINVLNEVYESGLDPEDFADEIRYRGLNPGNLRVFYPDPADPLSSRILEKKLGIRAMGGTGGELNNRINWIRKALREPRITTTDDINSDAGSMRPRLMFDRKCKNTIEDFLNYRYPEIKSEQVESSTKRYELPMKKDDHGPEALGRMFAGLFGTFGKPHTGTRIHKASFSRNWRPEMPQDKDEIFRRPAANEKRRETFPKVNDALDNYLQGVYDG
jgi:Terminase large subunit, T4likevirus-type, N-terminal